METAKQNVNQVERIASTVLGGALLIRSLTRRSPVGRILGIALLYRGVSGHSYLYQALGVNTAYGNKQEETGAGDGVPVIERSITVEKPANELYRYWRDPQELSKILGKFGEVTAVDGNRMHWRLNVPFQRNMEWETQIVEDRPGQVLRWESVEGARMPNQGTVRFIPAPGDWGTETKLYLRFEPPGGTLGKQVVKRLNIVPRLLAERVLRRFKSLAETGEMPTLERNPSARVGSYSDTYVNKGENADASTLLERGQRSASGDRTRS
jgi:uncharacterized membrane protein